MSEVVIVEAVRTPLGRRNGGLSTCHSIDVLAAVQKELFERSGVDPKEVGQVVGGWVGQDGMQTMNDALQMLYVKGEVTLEEALKRSGDPNELLRAIGEPVPGE